MRILMIAADPMEFPGVLRHAAGIRPAAVPVDWSRTGRMGEHDVLLAANGAGARRASAAVDGALRGFAADCVVSTGFCGALAPELRVGDVVVGTGVAVGAGILPAVTPSCGLAHHTGVVCSIDHVAQSASEKRQLRATGASAVEMEAGGVAERAAVHGVPFYCVRVVTDMAEEEMSNDFNGALRSDGHFATMKILKGAFGRPLTRVPELLRLRRRCVVAARVLGDFVADCKF